MDMPAIIRRHSGIKVIPYSPEYRDQVIAGAHEMHKNSIYRDMPLDTDKVIRQLASCGNIVPDRYFMLAVRGEEVLGGFLGCVHPTFFCSDLLARDMGWWVLRKNRGGAAAVILLNDFKRWASEKGARKVMVGQSTAEDIARVTKLYEHCGFRIIGFNAVKDLTWVPA